MSEKEMTSAEEFASGLIRSLNVYMSARSREDWILVIAYAIKSRDAAHAAKLLAAEQRAERAEAECAVKTEALSIAISAVDEAYSASGYMKIATTSEQRLRIDVAMRLPAGDSLLERHKEEIAAKDAVLSELRTRLNELAQELTAEKERLDWVWGHPNETDVVALRIIQMGGDPKDPKDFRELIDQARKETSDGS